MKIKESLVFALRTLTLGALFAACFLVPRRSKEPNRSSTQDSLSISGPWRFTDASSDSGQAYAAAYVKRDANKACVVYINVPGGRVLLETYTYRNTFELINQTISVTKGSDPVETYKYFDHGLASDKKIGPDDPEYRMLQKRCYPMLDSLPTPGHKQLTEILGGRLPAQLHIYIHPVQ